MGAAFERDFQLVLGANWNLILELTRQELYSMHSIRNFETCRQT